MKLQHFTIALTAMNLILLVLLLTGAGPAKIDPSQVTPVLRGRAFELVDEHGMVRTKINVESGGGVILRMIDQEGRIRVKLGAGKEGSGLLLADETTEPGINMIARRRGTREQPNTTSIMVKTGGKQRVITPGGVRR
jgi:hypothetical protein